MTNLGLQWWLAVWAIGVTQAFYVYVYGMFEACKHFVWSVQTLCLRLANTLFEAFEHFVCSEKTQISNDRFGFKLLLIVFSSSGIIPFGAANACYEDQAEEFVDSEKVLIAFLRFFSD